MSSGKYVSGGRLVGLYMLRVLSRMFDEVHVFTADGRWDPEHVGRFLGDVPEPASHSPLSLRYALECSKCVTVNADANLIPVPASILYYHTVPFEDYVYGFVPGQFAWPIYALGNALARAVRPKLCFTNSTFTKSRLGFECGVLHPPVDVWDGPVDCSQKTDGLLYVGRLSPDKDLHLLKSLAREFEVAAAGYVVFEHVARELERAGVRVVRNPSRREKYELMLKYKVFVNPKLVEPFGIAPVEAMSCGAVPVVSYSSGVYWDVVRKYGIGVGFGDIREAAGAALKSWSRGLCRKAVKAASEFRPEKFERKFAEAVASVL